MTRQFFEALSIWSMVNICEEAQSERTTSVAGEEKRAGVAAGPKGPGWSLLFVVCSLRFGVWGLEFGV